MRTKILYVLVSSGKDFYLEQAYVSMFSAKYHNPGCHIVLLCDTLTQESFVGKRKEMAALADEIVAVDLDKSLSGQKRSRLLKTSARLHVDGDYIFIDTDTVIARPLDEIDNVTFEMAACKDTHAADFADNPYRPMCLEHATMLGIDISEEKTYFNSGVIYVKDCPATRTFFETWNRNYLIGFDKGVSMDQPTFCQTNIELGHPVKVLSDFWNCELKHGIKFLKDAFIVHYLCTNKIDTGVPLFIMHSPKVMQEIRESDSMPQKVVDAVRDPFTGLADITHCYAGTDVDFTFEPAVLWFRDLYYERPNRFRFLWNCVCKYKRVMAFFKGTPPEN